MEKPKLAYMDLVKLLNSEDQSIFMVFDIYKHVDPWQITLEHSNGKHFKVSADAVDLVGCIHPAIPVGDVFRIKPSSDLFKKIGTRLLTCTGYGYSYANDVWSIAFEHGRFTYCAELNEIEIITHDADSLQAKPS